MNRLADSTRIRGIYIRNRIVMPPIVCFSFQGDNGGPYGQQHVDHYTARADGGTGLVIVQATQVAGAAAGSGPWGAEQQKVLATIAANCRQHGAAVMMQLGCGNVDVNALSVGQIDQIRADCVAAAAAARRAGFDGVEYHAAHGYTLCQFFDPSLNQRTDRYGGSLENRARILTEIMPEIRNAIGEESILGVRISGTHLAGNVVHDVPHALQEAGVDILHVSFGLHLPSEKAPEGFLASPMAYLGTAIKKTATVPVIGVGSIFTAETATFLIERGHLDYVAAGRACLADANWANHVLAGQPINQCRNCGGGHRTCLWFTNHTLCPAAKIRS